MDPDLHIQANGQVTRDTGVEGLCLRMEEYMKDSLPEIRQMDMEGIYIQMASTMSGGGKMTMRMVKVCFVM